MRIYECKFVFKQDNPCSEETFELKVDLQSYYPLEYQDIKQKAFYEAAKVCFPEGYKTFNKVDSFCIQREYEI